jgi:hypothetical protein
MKNAEKKKRMSAESAKEHQCDINATSKPPQRHLIAN